MNKAWVPSDPNTTHKYTNKSARAHTHTHQLYICLYAEKPTLTILEQTLQFG